MTCPRNSRQFVASEIGRRQGTGRVPPSIDTEQSRHEITHFASSPAEELGVAKGLDFSCFGVSPPYRRELSVQRATLRSRSHDQRDFGKCNLRAPRPAVFQRFDRKSVSSRLRSFARPFQAYCRL